MNDIIKFKMDNIKSNKDEYIRQKTDGLNKFYLQLSDLKFHIHTTYEHKVIQGTKTETINKTQIHNEIEQIINIINNNDRKYIKYDRSINKSELYEWFYYNIINSMKIYKKL